MASVLDKLKQNNLYKDLYKDLLKERNPLTLEKRFKDFIIVNELGKKQDIQNLFAFLKLEGLFKQHIKTKEIHDVWLKLRNELAPGFLIEN